MSLSSESYNEYYSYCDKCNEQVIQILEYMDLTEFDDKCGVCSKCRKIFCKNCVIEENDEIYCPECSTKLLDFLGCSVYDCIAILQHTCQSFRKVEGGGKR